MKKKVRCNDCDAVGTSEEVSKYILMKKYSYYHCCYCNSVNTVETNEQFRPPVWERESGEDRRRINDL